MGSCRCCGNPVLGGYNQTCELPFCNAYNILHPRWRKRSEVTSQAKNKIDGRIGKDYRHQQEKVKSWDISPEAAKLLAANLKNHGLMSANWEITGFSESTDIRGSSGRLRTDLIWGLMSRVNVFLRCKEVHPHKASVVIRRQPGESVRQYLIDQWMGGVESPYLSMMDVFYAWRCCCDENHHVTYRTLDDIPEEDGYHSPCMRCGGSPLEVMTWV